MTDTETRGAEVRALIEQIGWSNNTAARRMDISFAWMGQIRAGTREISDAWLSYFRAVARAVTQIPLPSGETDDVSDLPPDVTVAGLTPFQREEVRQRTAVPRDTLLAAMVASFGELSDEMRTDELKSVRTGLMMVAERLGIGDELIEALQALPRPEVMSEHDLARGAEVVIAGVQVAQVWRETPD